jgi:hypothetical protein
MKELPVQSNSVQQAGDSEPHPLYRQKRSAEAGANVVSVIETAEMQQSARDGQAVTVGPDLDWWLMKAWMC